MYDEYAGSDISDQMESICLLGTFLSRCNDTLNNLCSQIFAIFNEEIINLSKFLYYYLFEIYSAIKLRFLRTKWTYLKRVIIFNYYKCCVCYVITFVNLVDTICSN